MPFFFILAREYTYGFERERNIDVTEKLDRLPPVRALPGNQTHNLGRCPDQESNLQPFGVWDDAPANAATWPGLPLLFFLIKCFKLNCSWHTTVY